MEIDSVVITGTENEISQARSVAENHELQARSVPVEVGKHKLTVEKNEPEQVISHYLFSLGFKFDCTPIQQLREDT